MNSAVLKKAIVNVIGIVGVAALSSSLHAASFDCAKAATTQEKMICKDEDLSLLDAQLANLYKLALDSAQNKEVVKRPQVSWLKETRNACKDTGCLKEAYTARMEQLKVETTAQLVKNAELKSSAPETKQQFKLTQGEQFQLCKDFLALINRVEKKPLPNCHFDYPFDDIAKKQAFKDVEWVEVNRKDYKALLKNRYIYREYRVSESTINERSEKFESFFDKSNTRMWTVTLDLNGDGKKDKVFKEKTENCGEGSGGDAFIKREDDVLDNLEHRRTADNDLFFYQGKVYFYRANYIGEFFGMDSYVTERGLCKFKKIY